MNKWRERIDQFKAALEETKEWSTENWRSLPEGVRQVIVRGEVYMEEKIEIFEKYARREEIKNEQAE